MRPNSSEHEETRCNDLGTDQQASGASGRRKRTFQIMPPCGAQGAKRSIFSASIALPHRLENKTATTTAAVVESILECRR
jgi:hypothetical protein